MPTVKFFVRTLEASDPFLASIPTPLQDRSFRSEPGFVRDSILLATDVRGMVLTNMDEREVHIGLLVTEYIEPARVAQMRARRQTDDNIASNIAYLIQFGPFGPGQLVFQHGPTGFGTSDVYMVSQDSNVDDSAEIVEVIFCTVEGARPIACCEHYIEANLADIKRSYRRSNLENWANISEQVRNFWNCATSS